MHTSNNFVVQNHISLNPTQPVYKGIPFQVGEVSILSLPKMTIPIYKGTTSNPGEYDTFFALLFVNIC